MKNANILGLSACPHAALRIHLIANKAAPPPTTANKRIARVTKKLCEIYSENSIFLWMTSIIVIYFKTLYANKFGSSTVLSGKNAGVLRGEEVVW